MARKVGFYSLEKVALRMCRLIVTFSPIIQALYPDSYALHTALNTALKACQELEYEIGLVKQEGV